MNRLLYVKIGCYAHRMNIYLGHTLAWFAMLLVIVMVLNVISRYLFAVNLIWLQELVRFIHVFLFMGCAGYTLGQNDHVRVDIFYASMRPYVKAWIQLVGALFIILPTALVIIWVSQDFVLRSWAIYESSSEYNGMPGIFILKSMIFVFAISLILESISITAQSIEAIREQRI